LRAAAVKDAHLRAPCGLVLDGREHAATLIAAGGQGPFRGRRLMFVSGVGASPCGTRFENAVSRLIEVTSTALPAGTGAGRFVAG
jgi:hypothetical protein